MGSPGFKKRPDSGISFQFVTMGTGIPRTPDLFGQIPLWSTWRCGPSSNALKSILPNTVWCSLNPGSHIGIPESGLFLKYGGEWPVSKEKPDSGISSCNFYMGTGPIFVNMGTGIPRTPDLFRQIPLWSTCRWTISTRPAWNGRCSRNPGFHIGIPESGFWTMEKLGSKLELERFYLNPLLRLGPVFCFNRVHLSVVSPPPSLFLEQGPTRTISLGLEPAMPLSSGRDRNKKTKIHPNWSRYLQVAQPYTFATL